MSSTCQQIITLAFEKLGVIPAGGTPDTADNTRALSQLRNYYQKLIGAAAFGKLTDRIATGPSTDAYENERIVHDGTVTINLPTTYPATYLATDYGLMTFGTDAGHVRPPMDLAIVSVVRTDTGAVLDYIYDNRIRKWCEINGLALTDVAPLSHRDEDGLASSLAMRLAPIFNQQTPQEVAMSAVRFEEDLTHNYSQDGEIVEPRDYW